MHVLLLPLSLFLILLFPYPYQSYPLCFCSFRARPLNCFFSCMQILAVLTLPPGAAERSADGFLFSHFGIYQCTLTYLCFHFSPSNSAPFLSKTLEIWQSQPVRGKCKVLRCSGVLCRQPAESGLTCSPLGTSVQPGPEVCTHFTCLFNLTQPELLRLGTCLSASWIRA